MGGDHGPPVTVPAALRALERHPELSLVLVGDADRLAHALRAARGRTGERLSIQHASQQIAMDERPSVALRNKRDSSMRVAVNLVKEGAAAACVSAGNTGALMATARFVLKTLPGIGPVMLAFKVTPSRVVVELARASMAPPARCARSGKPFPTRAAPASRQTQMQAAWSGQPARSC